MNICTTTSLWGGFRYPSHVPNTVFDYFDVSDTATMITGSPHKTASVHVNSGGIVKLYGKFGNRKENISREFAKQTLAMRSFLISEGYESIAVTGPLSDRILKSGNMKRFRNNCVFAASIPPIYSLILFFAFFAIVVLSLPRGLRGIGHTFMYFGRLILGSVGGYREHYIVSIAPPPRKVPPPKS